MQKHLMIKNTPYIYICTHIHKHMHNTVYQQKATKFHMTLNLFITKKLSVYACARVCR